MGSVDMGNKKPGRCYTLLIKDYRILKLIFTIFASYLIVDTFYTLLVRKPTYTSNEKRPISVDDFPEIIICPERSTDTTALNLRGYPSPEEYYKGLNFGWVGNRSEDVKDVYSEISTLKSNRECEHSKNHFGFYESENMTKTEVEFNLTRAFSPYHICCKIVPPELAKSVPLGLFAFQFKNHSLVNGTYRVFMADRVTASIFDQHKLSIMLGDNLVSKSDYNGYMVYRVKITEDIRLENDPHYPCIDYKIMGEYAECVENEIIEENFKYLNCTPPWMTEDEDLWCKGRREYNSTLMEEKHKRFVTKLGMIEAKSELCSVPCKVKRYHAEEIGVREWDNVKGGLAIWFENEVDIVRASWKIDEESLISSVGGFIGVSKNLLWLIIMLITSVGGLFSYLKMQKFEFDLF